MDSKSQQKTHMQTDRYRDRVAIQDLVHAYAEAIDDQEPATVAALFSSDAVFRAFDRPQGEARGPIEVQELVAKLIDSFSATLHHVSDVHLRFMADGRATGVTSLHAWHEFRSERPNGLLWGRYHDEFVRSRDGWKFAARTLTVAGQQDFDFPWIPSR